MKPNASFSNMSPSFWGNVKFISENLGYSKRGLVTPHSLDVIRELYARNNLLISDELLTNLHNYLLHRADTLNQYVRSDLMTKDQAEQLFEHYHNLYRSNDLKCALPFNKQKHEKRNYAFFTCTINILTEITLRQYAQTKNLKYGEHFQFDYDPRGLCYVIDKNGSITGALSRRFDGVFPSLINPFAVWEIKEYYYTTTFGSRIADGVYETQLDGYEIKELRSIVDHPVKHYYFVDDYNTWWNMGSSYLCRIIDALHQGLVDEVFFGKEIIRWPDTLSDLVDSLHESGHLR